MMNRRLIYRLLLSLSVLLPTALSAQELSRLYYWFDDDIGSRQSISISGSQKNIAADIPTDGLAGGIHQLHTQVYRSDGWYSPVSTSVFFKRPEGSGGQLESWFDNDYDHRATHALTADGQKEIAVIDMSDADLLPAGLHQVHLRVASEGQAFGSVYTTMVCKVGSGDVDKLEYWIDSDYKSRKTVDYTSVNKDSVKFFTGIDLNSIPTGLHAFNYRAISSKGTASSAVNTMMVLRSGTGDTDRIEYWIDDDYDNRKTISSVASGQGSVRFASALDLSYLPVGVYRLHYRVASSKGNVYSAISTVPIAVTSGSTPNIQYWIDDDFASSKQLKGQSTQTGYHFFNDVDLNALSPGAHRLNYRAVMADGKATGAIMSDPVIVNSRYNSDPSEAVITSYSVLVDNKEVDAFDVLGNPKSREIPYQLDATGLSVGDHQVSIKAWNSMGTSATDTKTFSVVARTAPTLTLTAEAKDGKVKLKLGAVPNDIRYRIIRKTADGASVKVIERESVYPVDITYEDVPGEGEFTYFAQCVYQETPSAQKRVDSENVTVAVSQATTVIDDNVGHLEGYTINRDNELVWAYYNQAKWDSPYVRFMVDEKSADHSYINNGHFFSDDLPVGTVVTLLVENSPWIAFSPVTVTIKKGVNKVLLVGVNKEDLEPNSQAYDLELTSDVEWKNGFFVFNVKNRSKKAWKGKVRFRAVNETNYNKIRRNQQNPGDAEQASLMEQIWFYSETEEEVSLAGNASTQVYLTLNEVFPDDKRDYYYFYLESVGKWTNGVQQDDEVKQIACFNSDLNVNSLPFNRQIDKSSLAKATDLQRLKDAEYAANLILAICSSINSVDKTLGDIKSTCKKINRGYVELESDIAFVSKYDKDFESLMQSTQAQRLAANFMVTTGVHIIDDFREKMVADILASSKTVSAYLGPAMDVLKQIRTYEESYKMTNYEKMFTTADKILDFAKGKVGSPFIDIMATYLDVTKSIINYALQLGEQYYASTSSFMLYENIPSTEADKKKFKYNRNIDFKIMVSPRRSLNWFNFEKRGERGKNIIKSAVVKVNNKKNEPEAVATLLMEPVAVDDGIMLRQVGFDSGGPMGQGYLEMSIPFNRMWMEITWKNGRTSTIPLLDAGDAVKFELPDIFGHNTYRYTVYFDSEATSDHFENLADILTLKE